MKPNDRRQSDRRVDGNGAMAIDRRNGDRRQNEDRRQQPRLPVELWVEEMAGDSIYLRHTANLSEGGMMFDVALPHPLGTLIHLKFTLPGDSDPIIAHGTVVSSGASDEGLGMGIEFVGFEGDGQQRLQAFITSS